MVSHRTATSPRKPRPFPTIRAIDHLRLYRAVNNIQNKVASLSFLDETYESLSAKQHKKNMLVSLTINAVQINDGAQKTDERR